MEIISKHPKLLSDFEVYECLQSESMSKYVQFSKYRTLIRETIAKERKTLANTTANSVSPLTDYTVNERKSMQYYSSDKLTKLEDTAWMKEKLTQYLSDKPSASQDRETIKIFIREVVTLLGDMNRLDQSSSLTRGELLQLLNIRPTSTARLSSCIRNLQERLDDTQTADLLSLVEKYLPEPPVVDEDDEGYSSEEDKGPEEAIDEMDVVDDVAQDDDDDESGLIGSTSKYGSDESVMDDKVEEQL